jgi:hypothetical protein
MAVRGETQVPILPDLDLAVPPRQRVAGEQTFEVTEERLLPRRRMIGQIIGQRGVIDFRRDGARLDERLDLRCEIERAVAVQRVINGMLLGHARYDAVIYLFFKGGRGKEKFWVQILRNYSRPCRS